MSSAGVEVQWQPVPSPAQIEKRYTKKFRRELHGLLADPSPIAKKQVAYASVLLEQRPAEEIIAALLEMAEPRPALEGFSIEEVAEGAGARRRSAPGAYRAFEINWGRNKGATASRVLSHICRRGNLKSADVGAIRLGPSFSTFEVAVGAAEGFEKACRRPDERDPALRIRPRKGASEEVRNGRPRQHRSKGRGGPRGRAAGVGGRGATS